MKNTLYYKKNLEYAEKAYGMFVDALKKGATSRACIFATRHRYATELLMKLMEESGIKAKVKCLCGVYSNVGKGVFYDGVTPVPTKVMFDFICEYEGGECRTSEESDEVLWVPKEKVLDYISKPVLRYRFEKILNFEGKITYASYVTKPEFQVLTERYI